MKINPTNSSEKINAYRNSTVKKVHNQACTEIGDKLELSEDAKIYSEAIKKAKETSDIRLEKVNDIKSRIDAGTYNIDSKKVAEKMLEGIHFDTEA